MGVPLCQWPVRTVSRKAGMVQAMIIEGIILGFILFTLVAVGYLVKLFCDWMKDK